MRKAWNTLKRRLVFVGITLLSAWAIAKAEALLSWASIPLTQAPVLSQDHGDSGKIMGRIVGIVDGDTIELFDGKEERRVRLAFIDAPEKGQPYGQEAKKALSKLAYQCAATLFDQSTDRYGRTVARIKACGRDLGEEMVDAGYAWVYEAYAKEPWKSHLERLQERAQKAKRGLWNDTSPVPPWQWRKDH